MIDYSELKLTAQDAVGKEPGSPAQFLAWQRMSKLANPAAVLDLIEQNEALRGLYEMHKATETREMRDLKAECEALRKDAERYRWLRSRDSSDDPELNVVRWARQSSTSATGESPRLEELDSAIDAAMGKEASHD